MSTTPNPYAPSSLSEPAPNLIKVRPIQLLRRSYQAIQAEYWLFLAITVVGIVIASLVPFWILLGPMMVGIFLCFQQRQQSGVTEFGTLMKGFDQFVDSLLATLIMLAFQFAVIVPLVLAFVIATVLIAPTLPAAPGAAQPLSIGLLAILLAFYPVLIAANIAIYIPFLFVYQLIADRKLTAGAAVMTSARAAWRNIGGIIWFVVVTSFAYVLAMIPCLIPAILMLPIWVGALWVLYQDVFDIDPALPDRELR